MAKKSKRKGRKAPENGTKNMAAHPEIPSSTSPGAAERDVAENINPPILSPLVQESSGDITVEDRQELTVEALQEEPRHQTGYPSCSNISEIPPVSLAADSSSSTLVEDESTERTSDLEDIIDVRQPVVAIMPPKPKIPGKLGRKVTLISNCFPLKFDNIYVYHYDVEIIKLGPNAESVRIADDCKKYRCLNTRLNRKVFEQLQGTDEHFQGLCAVFDGKRNMYASKKLPKDRLECQVLLYEYSVEFINPFEENTFKIIIKAVKKQDGSCVISLEPLGALFRGELHSVPQEALMVLETVLRQSPCLRYVPVGRSFFNTPLQDESRPLGFGKEVWFGYHQSVRLGQRTPMVNLDITATTFYKSMPVIDYIAEFLDTSTDRLMRIGSLQDKDIVKLNNDLKGVNVKTTHMSYPRKYRVFSVTRENANALDFDLEVNGVKRKITVKEYFLEHYGRRLMYSNLPCFQVKAEKAVYLPLELCEIVKEQHSRKDLNSKQQAEMIKFTATPPRDRFSKTTEIHENCDFNNDPYLENFGIKVLDHPLKVDARILETPSIVYHPVSVRPKNGSWNMIKKQYFKGTSISKWVLLSFAHPDHCSRQDLEAFSKSLHRYANEQGINLEVCAHTEEATPALDNVESYIRKMKREFKAELIFVVLPFEPKDLKRNQRGRYNSAAADPHTLYSEIKRIAEINIGVVTQCVKGVNVVDRGQNASFVSNLCLKLNAKMGGINNSLMPQAVYRFREIPVIIIGIDVNHSIDVDSYSLAAAVGSVDEHFSRYSVTLKAQQNEKRNKKTLEVIREMNVMVRKLLMAFYRNLRLKPKKIIVYRDGVSEGQFADVQEREIKKIREACTSLEAGYEPGITYIVVQKRHHVRFLPERGGQNDPGTVVDSQVTHPLNFDFYLYSHFGMKGTSRPSYYTVLADDNNFSFDGLEKLTYSLCHTYVRCTKSISLPAPVQYADLAAYRARRHLTSYLKDLESEEFCSINAELGKQLVNIAGLVSNELEKY
ncbi:hypothetical protein CDAR_492341 [Caerostris darwini]|uniref:Uncharacterized protein n=1 Tax=Caerostris darwini TaxID=1538125 RepID=A0AAV4UZ64_9ARAC|nr:hypothetical protein CDAR_492341 [Caerostris darwini]